MSGVRAFLATKLSGGDSDSTHGGKFSIQVGGIRRDGVLDPHNRRIKLYGFTPAEMGAPEARTLIEGLGADSDLYTKLTVYAPPGDEEGWSRLGFEHEGTILGYFRDHRAAEIWVRYADAERRHAPRDGEHDRIVAMASKKKTSRPELAPGYTCRVPGEAEVSDLAALLRATFTEYPIDLDEGSIRRAIADKANHFLCVFDAEGTMVAAASAELDHAHSVAEMTDCATDPAHRGRGLMAYILWRLEKDTVALYGITDVYTLARADEPGMNCAFSKLGYSYTGRLVNNCRMPNGWESMNIWCRSRAGGVDSDPPADSDAAKSAL